VRAIIPASVLISSNEVFVAGSSTNPKHLSNLKEAHTRRLEVLQIQQAQFGIHCPPHITLEIQDIETKIDNIDEQIRVLGEPNSATPPRRSTSTSNLEEYVTNYLRHQINNGLEFTAYDITFALRRRLPDVEIRHTEVRRIVHLQMRLIVALDWYKQEITEYDTASARRYILLKDRDDLLKW